MSLEQLITPVVPLSASFTVAYEQYVVSTATVTQTLTAGVIAGGIITSAPVAPITLTMPTATSLLAVIPSGCRLGAALSGSGTTLVCTLVNTSANAITLAAGTGVSIGGLASATVAANTSRVLFFVCTSVSAPTFVVYG